MKNYVDFLADALRRVREIQPWDLNRQLMGDRPPLLLDVREPVEYSMIRIPGSINVPRGVLEQACEWDFEETVPDLAGRRVGSIVVVCRSGNRSILAADVMQQMGFADVVSLKTGVRGWNDFEQPLVDAQGRAVDADDAERLLAPSMRPEQRRPGRGLDGRQ
jgi:rhodanese-related sulfurtransferase